MSTDYPYKILKFIDRRSIKKLSLGVSKFHEISKYNNNVVNAMIIWYMTRPQ